MAIAKYRVIRGMHSQKNGQGLSQVYNKGDVFEARKEVIDSLDPFREKFERVETEVSLTPDRSPSEDPVTPQPGQSVEPLESPKVTNGFEDTLNEMTVEQLRKLAADDNITVPAGSRKADIVALLLQAQNNA